MENVTLERQGPIGIITVNRPAALNALNDQVLNDLYSAFKLVDEDKTLRCVVLTGAGEKAFVAGADIKGFQTMTAGDAVIFAEKGQKIFRFLEVLRIPVIAAVNGFALGGGCELAMACDFIVASRKAKFGLPEVTLGLIPGFGGTQRLARYVGLARARELTYSGRVFTAEEAEKIGLAVRVVEPDQLLSTCLEMAKQIASRAPIAVLKAKEVMNVGFDLPLDEGLHEERLAFSDLFRTQDVREGVLAFVEKREAQFKGE